jgi:hypothetical protein
LNEWQADEMYSLASTFGESDYLYDINNWQEDIKNHATPFILDNRKLYSQRKAL